MTVTERDLQEIQGLVVRGYRHHRVARHFVVSVARPQAARSILGQLATGSKTPDLEITAAEWWGKDRPDYALNATLTYKGLASLGVSPASLSTFPFEFRQGAINRAPRIYDYGDSAPSNWWGGMDQEDKVHLIFSLFAVSPSVLDQRTSALRNMFQPGFSENYSHDAAAFPGGFVHFGYKDGISQPHIEGVEKKSLAYPLPSSPAGDFILGYESSFGWHYYPELAHSVLGRNGSFGAFRILEQDVAGFEAFLQDAAPKAGMSPGLLAAKLMGRWRSGEPLELSPTGDRAVPKEKLNMFLYSAAAPDQPQADPQGIACPIGAHIRRANPRDQFVSGGLPQASRLLRHSLPFGPPFDPQHPKDGIKRGQIGYFINANFNVQFELVMNQWVNTDGATMGCISGKDAIVGANDPSTSVFSAPTAHFPGYPRSCDQVAPKTVRSFSRFVNTRGSAYCFFPSIEALKYIASL
jgi:deferrochelatase/peroxidase EfeB